MIPGINILAIAQTVQSKLPFIHRQYTGRTTNALGFDVATYTPIDRTGSIQAVDRKLYTQMGLDFKKSYIAIWVTADLADLGRGRAGDQVVFGGQLYEIMDQVDWFPIDGWDQVVCVRVANE